MEFRRALNVIEALGESVEEPVGVGARGLAVAAECLPNTLAGLDRSYERQTNETVGDPPVGRLSAVQLHLGTEQI